MSIAFDLAILLGRQIGIHNGDKPLPLGTLDMAAWMKANNRRPGDDCTDYPGFAK